MFNAALIDAFPEHEAGATAAAQSVAGVRCLASPHRDHVLTGRRFVVGEAAAQGDPGSHHDHARWREIRARIEASSVPVGVKRHAVGIFARLADAEAHVHGIEVEAVTFHEVGSADSIADIVAAAWLIDALDGAAWSVGPLPLGSGQVRTAHGVMPVPAPATARLLEGFAVLDDGIAGERVTPTGAAILRHLAPVSRAGLTGRIARSGFGFGTRRLPGISNVLRVLALEADPVRPQAGTHRELAVIGFEV
ncbi:MAG: nickel insertion protein, partial [Geminicoccaceae bacterium]